MSQPISNPVSILRELQAIGSESLSGCAAITEDQAKEAADEIERLREALATAYARIRNLNEDKPTAGSLL